MGPTSLFKYVQPLSLFLHLFPASCPSSLPLLTFPSLLSSLPLLLLQTHLFFLPRGGIMSVGWLKWEVSFKSLEGEYFLMDIFLLLFGLFFQWLLFHLSNERWLWAPLISGQLEDAFKFFIFFPLTNAPRRSLSGPRDSSGWSITARTSASQRIISWMGGSGEGERGARLVSSVKGSDGLLSLEVLWDSPKDIHSSPSGWPSPLIFYSK